SAKLTELERQRVVRDELRQQFAASERALIEAQSQMQRLQERQAELSAARAELAQLADPVAAQSRLETRLAELRESRGEWQSLERARLALDKDLEQMRQRYTTLSREIEKAENLRAQAESVAQLEEQRARLDAELARQELALSNAKLQREYLDKTRKEAMRLNAEAQKRQAELTRLETLVASAARVGELETRQQRDTEQVAQLRAEVARDEEMIQSLARGGICPLLTEKCLNLKPGESLDARFRSGLE